MRCAEEYGLLLERDGGLAMLQDPLGHVARLVDLVTHRHRRQLPSPLEPARPRAREKLKENFG